jgi:hypothetical protein
VSPLKGNDPTLGSAVAGTGFHLQCQSTFESTLLLSVCLLQIILPKNGDLNQTGHHQLKLGISWAFHNLLVTPLFPHPGEYVMG